jgi:hypothetical protein
VTLRRSRKSAQRPRVRPTSLDASLHLVHDVSTGTPVLEAIVRADLQRRQRFTPEYRAWLERQEQRQRRER